MLLHTIVGENPARAKELGIPLTFELARFIKFIIHDRQVDVVQFTLGK